MKCIRVWPWNITCNEVYLKVHTSLWGAWPLCKLNFTSDVKWHNNCAILKWNKVFPPPCAFLATEDPDGTLMERTCIFWFSNIRMFDQCILWTRREVGRRNQLTKMLNLHLWKRNNIKKKPKETKKPFSFREMY